MLVQENLRPLRPVGVPRLQVPVEVAVHQVLLLVRHQEVLEVHHLLVHLLLMLYLRQIIG